MLHATRIPAYQKNIGFVLCLKIINISRDRLKSLYLLKIKAANPLFQSLSRSRTAKMFIFEVISQMGSRQVITHQGNNSFPQKQYRHILIRGCLATYSLNKESKSI